MKHKPVKQHEYTKISENKVELLRKICPRCTDAFLAHHKDRLYCGKCHFTDFAKA